jgi:hypothetical protein
VVYQVFEPQPDPQGSRPSRAEFFHAATDLRVVRQIHSLAMAEQLHALGTLGKAQDWNGGRRDLEVVVARTANKRLNCYSTVDRYAIFIGLTPL